MLRGPNEPLPADDGAGVADGTEEGGIRLFSSPMPFHRHRDPMTAMSRTLLIAGAAFASGVAGTIALVAPGTSAPPAATGAQSQAAATREWADPVKAPAASTASAAPSPQRSVVRAEAESPAPILDGTAGRPVQAERIPARRRTTAEVRDAEAAHAETAPSRTVRPRPAPTAALVPQEPPVRRPSPVVVRQAPPREQIADARRAVERPPSLVMGRSRLPEIPPREPRSRLSSADGGGGVMGWLAQPTGRN